MFCQNCGSEIADGNNFCHNCGMGVAQNTGALKPKSNKKKICIIACIMAAVVAVSTFLAVTFVFSSDEHKGVTEKNYEEVAEKYITARLQDDFDERDDYSLFSVKDRLMKFENYTVDEVEEFFENAKKENEKFMLEEYGDYDISFRILETKDVELKDLYSFMELLFEEDYDFYYEEGNIIQTAFLIYGKEVNAIDKTVFLQHSVCISGTKKEQMYTYESILVRYDGEWKVFESDSSDIGEEFYKKYLQ